MVPSSSSPRRRMEWSLDGILDGLWNARFVSVAVLLIATLANGTFAVASTWNAVVGVTFLATVGSFLHGHVRKSNRYDWKAQSALVTGSSGGLGSAIVEELVQRGCGKIVCVDLHPGDSKALNTKNDQVHFERCDLSKDQAAVEYVLNEIKRKHGDVTILVSNAGLMVGKPLLELDEEQDSFERTLTVNFLATHRCLRVFLPVMLKRKSGHIVATASIMSYVGVSELSDYVASKHALAGLMESLRFELDNVYGLPGVRTTLLVLGQLRTPLFARIKPKPLPAFMMPLQDPAVIAKDVVNAIERDRSSYIYRPYLARFAPVLPALPVWLRNLVHDFSGANRVFRDVT